MTNEFKQTLDEIFEDTIYDMCDELPMASVYNHIDFAVQQLNRGAKVVQFPIAGYHFKINNNIGGFVSCSNSEETGVCSTLHMAFPNDGEHDLREQLENLVDMMNSAYYSCAFC